MNTHTVIPVRTHRTLRVALLGRRGPHRRWATQAPPGPGERVGMDPLLTAAEVAAMLRVSKAWVYAETRNKRIPHVPLGRYVRYRRSAVIEWIAALERHSSSGLRVPLGEE